MSEGGTVVARSAETGFNIWVEEADEVRDPPESFPVRETIHGVEVSASVKGAARGLTTVGE